MSIKDYYNPGEELNHIDWNKVASFINGADKTSLFDGNIPLDELQTDLGTYSLTVNRLTLSQEISLTSVRAFAPITFGALPTRSAKLKILADGVTELDFSGFKEMSGSSGYVNTSGLYNTFFFFYDGDDYWVTIFQEKNAQISDILAPVYIRSFVNEDERNKIYVEFNENFNPTFLHSAVDVSLNLARTVTNVEISTKFLVWTVNTPYAYGDVPVFTLTPGTVKLRDNAGNLIITAISNKTVTSLLTVPLLQSVTIDPNNPALISLQYSKLLGAASFTGSDFTTSPSKTLSAVINGSKVDITSTAPFANADIVSLSGGANKIKDVYGYSASNLSSYPVTTLGRLLKAYWKLDETTNTDPRLDSSGNGYTLTPFNPTSAIVPGFIGNAALLEVGSDMGFNTSANISDLSIKSTGFELRLWVKIPVSSPSMIIVAKSLTSSSKPNSREWMIFYNGTSHTLQWLVSTDGLSYNKVAEVDYTANNSWIFIRAFSDYQNIGISLNNGTPLTVPCVTYYNGTGSMYLGWDGNPLNTDYLFKGAIDEIGIFSAKLSDVYSAYLYNSGSGRTHPF